jgi:hypothetical protein
VYLKGAKVNEIMSLKRLQDLFESKGFVANNYFTLDGYYKLVEIINFKTAISLMVIIGGKHQVPVEKVKHEYELIKKNINGDLISGIADEAHLRSSYREIDHITKALESEEKFNELYDKPISLKGEEDRSVEKFASTIRQMRRFRLCVRNIPYKFSLFDDDCVCLLNAESEIETYYVVDYRHRKRKIFITTTIENFFATDDIEQSVVKINEQFYTILQENQRIETDKIQGMIDAKRNIVTQSRKILDMKKRLFDRLQKLQTSHSALLEKSTDLQRKRKEIKSSQTQGSVTDIASRQTLEKIKLDLDRIEDQQRDIIKNILDTRKDLDELCLVVDNILFDNMIMLSRIAHNFRVLEMLKIS